MPQEKINTNPPSVACDNVPEQPYCYLNTLNKSHFCLLLDPQQHCRMPHIATGGSRIQVLLLLLRGLLLNPAALPCR